MGNRTAASVAAGIGAIAVMTGAAAHAYRHRRARLSPRVRGYIQQAAELAAWELEKAAASLEEDLPRHHAQHQPARRIGAAVTEAKLAIYTATQRLSTHLDEIMDEFG